VEEKEEENNEEREEEEEEEEEEENEEEMEKMDKEEEEDMMTTMTTTTGSAYYWMSQIEKQKTNSAETQNTFKIEQIMKTDNEAISGVLEDKGLNLTEINHLIYVQ
jgi:hypothetical protein